MDDAAEALSTSWLGLRDRERAVAGTFFPYLRHISAKSCFSLFASHFSKIGNSPTNLVTITNITFYDVIFNIS